MTSRHRVELYIEGKEVISAWRSAFKVTTFCAFEGQIEKKQATLGGNGSRRGLKTSV